MIPFGKEIFATLYYGKTKKNRMVPQQTRGKGWYIFGFKKVNHCKKKNLSLLQQNGQSYSLSS